jgi:viroplasmin and RNaseH domain-containing protein
MSIFKEYLLKAKERAEAYLIDDNNEVDTKTKDDYIRNAEEGVIVVFRLYFKAKSGLKLTKVISGMVIENDPEQEAYVVETKNGLKYVVPYDTVIWVKTGGRFPRGVYEEMKKGSVVVDQQDDNVELGQLENDIEL